MTQEQRERIAEAEDILIHVRTELEGVRGESRNVSKLDTVIGKLENILYG